VVFSFSFFVASPSAGVGCGHPSSTSYRCVNSKVEHKKTYANAFGADGAGRLILITGAVCCAQGVVRARRRSENSWGAGWGCLAGHQQAQFLGGGLAGLEAPPVHRKAAGQGHDELFAPAGTGALHARSQLFAQMVVRLVAHQPPGRFTEGPAQARVAAFGQVALLAARARTVFAGTQPGVAGGATGSTVPSARRARAGRASGAGHTRGL
jgi:hypothetical protein